MNLYPKRKIKAGSYIDKDVVDNIMSATTTNVETVFSSGIDNVPVDGVTNQAISSNWAYDHVAAADPHTVYALDTDLTTHGTASDPHTVYALDTDLTTHGTASDPHTGYVLESLYDANTVLYATTDNTPVALVVGTSSIVGRKATGDITTLNGSATLQFLSGQCGTGGFDFNSRQVFDVNKLSLDDTGVICTTGTASYWGIWGGNSFHNGASIQLTGHAYASPGAIGFNTPNATGTAVNRVVISGSSTIAVLTLSKTTVTGLDISSGQVMKVNSTQVVSARVIDNRCSLTAASGDANTDSLIDSLRDAMISHGLIAPS